MDQTGNNETVHLPSAWRPVAGTFVKWPRRAADLRILDPCCGSGHFLVEALQLLVPLRMEEEGVATEEAIFSVLRDNLFGLEIDPRCTQIAGLQPGAGGLADGRGPHRPASAEHRVLRSGSEPVRDGVDATGGPG